MRKFLRAVLVGSSETFLAVMLVGVFALVFFAMFLVLFPNGTGLVDLYGGVIGRGGDRAADAAGAPPGGAGPLGKDGPAPDEVVALLARVSHSVKERRAEAVEWGAAREGMAIRHRQAIQTLARSSAVVNVAHSGNLTLGENTLAVFTRPEAEGAGDPRVASLVLVGGEVRGSVASGPGAAMAVVTSNGSSTIHPGGGSPAQYAVRVNADKSSTFSLYTGAAEVTAAGRTVRLGANEAVTVSPSSPPGTPIRLCDPPSLVAPGNDAVLPFGATAPKVEFRWTEVAGADAYRVVLARDARFDDVLLDKRVAGPRFVHGNLEPGRIFWRVSGVRAGTDGAPGAARELRLDRDAQPPALSVPFPEGTVESDHLLVQGRTEPGCRVFVADAPVAVSDAGEFRQDVPLKRGLNMIVIEAMDAAGNSAYQAKYVTAKY